MQSEKTEGEPSPPWHRSWNLFACVAVLLLVALAWHNRFVLDDAFISFRYARNLAAGEGLVYNPGEYVEGYSNFLWTLLLTVPFFFGIDVVTFSHILGICFFTGTLIVTYLLASRSFTSRAYGLLTVVLLGTNYTFSSFATSGLETMLQTFLFVCLVCVYHAYVRGPLDDKIALASLSLLSALALLTRLDSGLIAATVLVFAYGTLLGGHRSMRDTLHAAALGILPVLLVGGVWTAWKYAYYGSVLPNTFYVKIASGTSFAIGVYYVIMFYMSYLLLPFPILFGFLLYASHTDPWKRATSFLRTKNFAAIASPARALSLNPLQNAQGVLFPRLVHVLVVLWTLYVVYLGGDFMEFRLLVPILPIVYLLVVDVIYAFRGHLPVQAVLAALILLGTIVHAHGLDNERITITLVYPIASAHEDVYLHEASWYAVGETLGARLEEDNVSIAITAAGAIPYASNLYTIDMHGLTDPWVARYGDYVSPYPGHQRLAPFSYIVEKNAVLLVGHPWIVPTRDVKPAYTPDELRLCLWQPTCGRGLRALPEHALLLAIPVTENYTLLAVYLTPHPAVDDAIARHGWTTRPIRENNTSAAFSHQISS